MKHPLQEELALLPDYLAHHLLLSVCALAIGVSLSLPLAFLSLRMRGLRGPLLAFASTVQTIPGLALLALMVPLLSRIGFVPALIALVLYSMLPVLRNAITGLEEVDPSLVEAGTGLGMTQGQVLWQVRAPLALPVIVAGIRTATVWVVGMATLSTPVGATSLGNFIFSGLQTQNHGAVLVGCAAAAVLALALDLLIRGFELAARRRSAPIAFASGLGVLALLIGGLTPLVGSGADDGRPRVRIGAKTFTEQYILARVIGRRLEAAGFHVERTESLGSTVVFDALAAGELDVYVDYSGTIWANHMQREDSPGAQAVLAETTTWLDAEHGVLLLGALGFENAYALAMRRDRAAELGVATLADLAQRSPDLSIGGDYEFFHRPEWAAVRDAYGFRFAAERTFDSTLMYGAVLEGKVDAISAFSSDGRIAAHDLLVFADPKDSLPPYDAIVLVSPKARKDPTLVAALTRLIGAIDDDAMRRANMRVDVEGASLTEAALLLDDEVGGRR